MYENLALLAAFAFLFSAFAGGLEKTSISGPIVFVVGGLLLGPWGANWLTLKVDGEGVQSLAELTLAVLLFSDAASSDLATLKGHAVLPLRLLLFGLPLTIAIGFGFGKWLFPSLTLAEVGILAVMLAPTDAALGKAVVSNPRVPAKIREALNFESGLNDGICVPLLLLFLALATDTQGQGSSGELFTHLLLEELGIGLLVGLAVTFTGVQVLSRAAQRGWISKHWMQVPVAALGLTCFGVAQTLGGSGFIAAFSGGMLFGALAKAQKHKMLVSAEITGDLLSLLTWVLFGAAVLPLVFDSVSWQMLAYAALSLTVARILPVALVLTGTGLDLRTKLFVGWFGPRGLASIVFAVIVTNADVQHKGLIGAVAVWTVVGSVFAHGLSANPLANRIGKSEGTGAPADGPAREPTAT